MINSHNALINYGTHCLSQQSDASGSHRINYDLVARIQAHRQVNGYPSDMDYRRHMRTAMMNCKTITPTK